MKSGRTLQDLAAEIERQADSRRDFLAPTQRLTMSVDAEAQEEFSRLMQKPTGIGRKQHYPVTIAMDGSDGNSERFGVNRFAHSQIAQRLGIPEKYYGRMATEAPELLTRNVNHWFRTGEEVRMVRTLDGDVRAFLSDRYRTIDNFDLLMTILPIIQESGMRIESAEVTERRLYVKAVNERLEGEIKRGDVVQAGAVFSNSEVGSGTMKIEQMVFRLVCLNGMIGQSLLRKMHLGRAQGDMDETTFREMLTDETKRISDKALWGQVRDVTHTILSDKSWFDGSLQKMRDASERKIEGDPLKAVEELQKQTRITDNARGNILRHLIEGGDLSQWGVVNAITRASQDMDDYDDATEFETLGGKVLELPKDSWKRIATAS